MMTTSVNSVISGLDPRQMMRSAQPNANEKTAAEELKAEEQRQAENISTPKITIGKSPMDVRMYQIHQAADAGILRPVWVENLEMAADMPRMRDLLERAVKNKEAKRIEEEARRAEKSGNAPEEAKQAEKTERVAEGTERAVKSERAAEEARRAEKSERAAEGTEHIVKSEHAANASGRAENSSE